MTMRRVPAVTSLPWVLRVLFVASLAAGATFVIIGLTALSETSEALFSFTAAAAWLLTASALVRRHKPQLLPNRQGPLSWYAPTRR
jgi:hypothetical protein